MQVKIGLSRRFGRDDEQVQSGWVRGEFCFVAVGDGEGCYRGDGVEEAGFEGEEACVCCFCCHISHVEDRNGLDGELMGCIR